MKNIFDFNPSEKELSELFGYVKADDMFTPGFCSAPIALKDYNKVISEEEKAFDAAKLLEYRGNKKEAAKYWAKIPEFKEEYQRGFDFIMIES